MSIDEIIKNSVEDGILARNFIDTWHIINEILVSFSKATDLPISIFLGDKMIFHSPRESMSPLCQKMLSNKETAKICYADASIRALEKPEKKKKKNRQIQICHAGMINAKREIETGIGTLSILFGFKPSLSLEAKERREDAIKKVEKFDEQLAAEIQNITLQDNFKSEGETIQNNYNLERIFFEDHDTMLIDSITKVLKLLLDVMIGFQSLTINMAHELVVMLVGINLMSQETSDMLGDIESRIPDNKEFQETVKIQKYISSETKLGLYMVRNYLSRSSEYRYSQVIKPNFEKLKLNPLINEMIDMYKWRADEKDIIIINEVGDLPFIWGDKMELRRALHNIFSNALKYSYHSIQDRRRNIKVSSRIPYDPGFKLPRFAISFENYGLGLEEDEIQQVLKPGFRGIQAIKEVAIGSGIGLSEVHKIIKLHKGEVKFQSRKLYGEGEESTYLTSVSLIFPFVDKH